jgi:hypothetical protein
MRRCLASTGVWNLRTKVRHCEPQRGSPTSPGPMLTKEICVSVVRTNRWLDSGENGDKTVKNWDILVHRSRTTNPEARTDGRRPEQPTNRPQTAFRVQGEGLSFVTKAHPTEVEGRTSLVPGFSVIAERVRSVFSHACAICTLCLILFVLWGSW